MIHNVLFGLYFAIYYSLLLCITIYYIPYTGAPSPHVSFIDGRWALC